MSEKTIQLLELVEKFNNFCESVDYIERKDASDILNSGLIKLNKIIGPLLAEVCVTKTTTDDYGIVSTKFFPFAIALDEIIKKYNNIARINEINKALDKYKKSNNEVIEKNIEGHVLFLTQDERDSHRKKLKEAGLKVGFIRSYIYEKQHSILINEWDWKKSNGDINTINNSPDILDEKGEYENIPSEYEPLLYEEYSNSTALFPLFYHIKKEYANPTGTSKNMIGLLHLEHTMKNAFETVIDPDESERIKMKYPALFDREDLKEKKFEGTQFEVLSFFAESIAKLFTKSMEWEKYKSDTEQAIKRFKSFKPDEPFKNQGGIFIRPRDESFTNIQSKFKKWFDNEVISCEYGDDRSDPSEDDIQKSFFGVFDITGFHPKVMTELGEAIAKGKPSLVLRDYNDAVVSEKVPEKIMISGSATFFLYRRVKKNKIWIIEKINDDGTFNEVPFEEFDKIDTLNSFINSVKPQHSISDN